MPEQTPAELLALILIRSTFPRLDAWHRPLASALEPAPGSALSAHDAEWPKYPATDVVKVGLGSAP